MGWKKVLLVLFVASVLVIASLPAISCYAKNRDDDNNGNLKVTIYACDMVVKGTGDLNVNDIEIEEKDVTRDIYITDHYTPVEVIVYAYWWIKHDIAAFKERWQFNLYIPGLGEATTMKNDRPDSYGISDHGAGKLKIHALLSPVSIFNEQTHEVTYEGKAKVIHVKHNYTHTKEIDLKYRFILLNKKPMDPVIEGRKHVIIGRTYTYKIRCRDPDVDDIRYIIDWGDGTKTETNEYYPSNYTLHIDKVWHCDSEKTYTITVHAIDRFGMESTATFDVEVVGSQEKTTDKKQSSGHLQREKKRGIILGHKHFNLNLIANKGFIFAHILKTQKMFDQFLQPNMHRNSIWSILLSPRQSIEVSSFFHYST